MASDFTENVLGKDNSLPQYWTLLLGAYQMVADLKAKSSYKTSGPSGRHLSLFLPRSDIEPGLCTNHEAAIPAMILYIKQVAANYVYWGTSPMD